MGKIKERIIKQKITTGLGLLMILAAIASVFFKNNSWYDATIGITTGFGLFFMKDDKLVAMFKSSQKNTLGGE